MKKTNFRIIELPNYQFLLMKDFELDDNNDNEEMFTCVMVFFLEGVKITQTAVFKNEESRDQMFERYDEESAQDLIDSVIAMME